VDGDERKIRAKQTPRKNRNWVSMSLSRRCHGHIFPKNIIYYRVDRPKILYGCHVKSWSAILSFSFLGTILIGVEWRLFFPMTNACGEKAMPFPAVLDTLCRILGGTLDT